jgi:hypothetical protein
MEQGFPSDPFLPKDKIFLPFDISCGVSSLVVFGLVSAFQMIMSREFGQAALQRPSLKQNEL